MSSSSQKVVLPPISSLFNDVDRHHHHHALGSRPPKLSIETSPSIIVTDPRHSSFQPPSPQSPVPASESTFKLQKFGADGPRPQLLSPISTPVSPQMSIFESSQYQSPLPPADNIPYRAHRVSSWSPDSTCSTATTSSTTLQIPSMPSHTRSYSSSPIGRVPMPLATHNPFKRRASDQSSNFSINMQQVKASSTVPPRRRRGRPPNATEQNSEGPYTFLTPTVWDVGAVNEKRDQDYYSVERKSTDHTVGILCDMSMDTLLTTPKRKRGRKPKHILEGNGCFVWKEIKSKRRSRKQEE
jgi:hypothetical protein